MKKTVSEQIIEIDNPRILKWIDLFWSIQKQIKNLKDKYIIKLNLVKSTKNKLYFNVVFVEGFKGFIDEPFFPTVEAGFPQKAGLPLAEKPASTCANDISCLIIPTGIGARFGGFAGDANPIANLIAKTSKYLLTHPNVVNGAVLSDVPDNLIYLEGFLLDQFLLGRINLIPTRENKIGVIFDKRISEERLDYEVNVLNALKAFYGCEIIGWTVTDESIDVNPRVNELGFSSGKINNLEFIIEKANKLKELGASAIAICCAISDLELNKDYVSGKGIDPIGGIESIISHSVSALTGLVSAHAPVLLTNEEIDYKKISPVSASEYIAKTFLPSVISGLRFAPQIRDQRIRKLEVQKSFQDIGNIIVPYNAFGSAGIFYLNEIFRNVILIKENKTCLEVDPNHLNISFKKFDNYRELIKTEIVKDCGIDPDVLKRSVNKVQKI